MPRGYRLLIIAFGLILCGAKPPQEYAQGQPSAKTTEQAAADAYAPYPGYSPDPCYQAKNHDAADLCAQWRAAVAAEKAAHEARRATSWSIVATFLSLITVGGLIITIWQTNGALGEARRGNRLNLLFEKRARRENIRAAKDQAAALEVAERQFQLAERTARNQIRSYLSVVVIRPHATGETYSAEVIIKNVGQTPARIKSVRSMFWIAAAHTVDPLAEGPPPKRYYHVVDVLPQGDTDRIIATCEDMSLANTIGEEGGSDVYVYGKVEFADVFGDDHWITFASCPNGWGFDGTTTFRPCIHGNSSD